MPVETELKWTLGSRGDYKRVLKSFPGQIVAQHKFINVFIDTKGQDFYKSGTNCRLRFIDDERCLLTLKTFRSHAHGLQQNDEEEEWVDFPTHKAAVQTPGDLFATSSALLRAHLARFPAVGAGDLVVVGSFATDRAELRPRGLAEVEVVEVDWVRFDDGAAFGEVEIEVPLPHVEAARIWFEAAAEAVGVDASPSRAGKYRRLRERLGLAPRE
eukprot:gnl/Chilomastix_cuspidata/3196.p1 GENE.gnl/Chilomastix_cuspidata/3196~~gnl/Chilomastix_cuspidata/3196.p1  ORF type:complete len:214 (-),score=69.74 gnl/Chilomastix_cuspidata/3196:13-654(-)